jgi:hypothetical protein
VAFLGDGVSGSWQIRGKQIASARSGWRSIPYTRLRPADLDKYHIFCLVKRFKPDVAHEIRLHGKLVVYDTVDPWKQPDDGLVHTTPEAVLAYFRSFFKDMPCDGVIFANGAMMADLGHLAPYPTAIYHHARPGLRPAVVRTTARVLGYEGDERYLGEWSEACRRACRRHGLQFVVNPSSFYDLDIGLTARGGPHASLMARRYKSNVKLANLLAAGIPCLAHWEEQSIWETTNGRVCFFSNEAQLEAGIESLLDFDTRRAIHESFVLHSRQFTLDQIARLYEGYFAALAAAAGQRGIADGVRGASSWNQNGREAVFGAARMPPGAAGFHDPGGPHRSFAPGSQAMRS